MATIKSGSVQLNNDFDSNSAGTAYAYRTAEDYGADYGLFGKIGNSLFGTNTAAENAASAYNAEMSNKFNADEAQKSRDWQEYMSNTAYQRAFADAQKAGINPYYLVSGSSSGASSGSSSAATSSGSPATSKEKSSGLKNAAGSALAFAKLIAILAA